MSFSRYRIRTPFGYGSRIFFCVCGNEVEGIHRLIDMTLERYARRFGALRVQRAESLAERIAHRESGNPIGTVRALALDRDVFHSYPKALARAEYGVRFIAPEGPFSAKEDWPALRQIAAREKNDRLIREYMKRERDKRNMAECRRLINAIKKELNHEATEDHRTVA